jgi:hypothetical protein
VLTPAIIPRRLATGEGGWYFRERDGSSCRRQISPALGCPLPQTHHEKMPPVFVNPGTVDRRCHVSFPQVPRATEQFDDLAAAPRCWSKLEIFPGAKITATLQASVQNIFS